MLPRGGDVRQSGQPPSCGKPSRGLRLVAVGGGVGLVLAVALRGALESLLVDVSSGDPRAYLLAASCLTVVAVAAALIPAMRAARMNPLEALRES